MSRSGSYWSTEGAYPPRRGNKVTALIDGEETFLIIAHELKQAQQYIYITGAFINLDFHLRPITNPNETLRSLLIDRVRAGVKVCVHFWNPHDKLFGKGLLGDSVVRDPEHNHLEGVNSGERSILARWDDAPGGMFGCHHQKTFVIDGKIAYVGGINSVQNYWDQISHPVLNIGRSLPGTSIHDIDKFLSVCPPLHDAFTRIVGPCVADVEQSFIQYWNAASRTHGTPQLEVSVTSNNRQSGGMEAQIVRTIGKGARCKRGGEGGIKEFYMRAFTGARRLIYLENQYFYDKDVIQTLKKNLSKNDDVYAISVLAAYPDAGFQRAFTRAMDAKYMRRFFDRDLGDYTGRAAFYSPIAYQKIAGKDMFADVYVHAKIGVFDDDWATIGSANLSSFSMEKHSEMNVVVRDREFSKKLRLRLWKEHLRQDLAAATSPHDAFRLWDAVATAALRARESMRVSRARVVPFRPPWTLVIE